MNNWPLFEQRYPPDTLSIGRGHQDTLVALVLIMLLVGAVFWGLQKRNSHQQSSVSRAIFGIYAVIQSIVIIGLLYANTLGASSAYWQATGKGILFGLSYFLLNTILYSLSWFAFGTQEHVSLWFERYFTAWGALGFALFIPLFITINGIGIELLYLAMIVTIYLLFRLLLLIISLTTFPKLRKYPLHIILYLCTCEIAPLLFLLV
ncbi:MAG: DUF4271 domain-containing protein [Bacteroidales bacterium]|uniref:DUF4271 domain-containing protein n=1 Tax=Porphyromonas sp. TaxID=1924944 RepID=UPI00297322D2|nr:DUF4271 domain-containing protein [Porphyromonas sp.]MDD7437227.1 DUF4271 domain-containing protein [Bacteroidales bacterium]MDY3066478.1 DUF4271 domain-containing protein [Porphyromonas sp.]